MKKQDSLVPAAGVAVAFVWGLTFLSTKIVVAVIPPMTLALMRFIVATPLLFVIALLSRNSLVLARKDMAPMALSGFVGVTLYFYFENNGILLLSASESSIIVGTIPVVTLVVDMLLFRRKAKPRVAAGIVLSFVGVVAIVLRGESAPSSLAGYLFMLGAVISWVAYSFITKPLADRYSLLSITFWQIFFGLLGCIPFVFAENPNLAGLSLPIAGHVLFLGVLASAIGYWFYVIVLDRLGASRSSVFINLIPVVSVAASYVFLGERLSFLQLAGGAAAMAGVYLATSK